MYAATEISETIDSHLLSKMKEMCKNVQVSRRGLNLQVLLSVIFSFDSMVSFNATLFSDLSKLSVTALLFLNAQFLLVALSFPL